MILHDFTPDGSGVSCTECGLPKGNWRHSPGEFIVRCRIDSGPTLYYGPFTSEREAREWADANTKRYIVIPLRSPRGG